MIGRGLLTIALLATTSLPALAASPADGPSLQASGPESPPPLSDQGASALAMPHAGPEVPQNRNGTTLESALAEVYLTNPALLAERAKLRATDENVPAALAGWRPQISYSVQPGFGYGSISSEGVENVATPAGIVRENVTTTTDEQRWTFTQQATLSQPIYRGGRTVAATAQAENQVRAERANLMGQEEQSFSDAINAFVTVIEDQQLYELQVSNVQVLGKQLEATNARFAVGEITRTDVAQAQAALAGAIAQRETAYGTLQTARATYRDVIGELPGKLVEPQPLALPVHTLQQAETLASVNNAAVVSSMYADATDKDAVDVAYAALMPQVSLQVTADYANQSSFRGTIQRGGAVGPVITVPIYQGGSEYAAIRQAKQNEQSSRRNLDGARRSAVQLATQYWQTYIAARSTVASTRAQIRADEIALDGVEREALAGTQTTLDVLNAQQLLLGAQVTLVQNLAALVTDSYSLAGAIGRLTARDLALHVPLYDPQAYYHAVRDLPFGTGDHAVNQPGR
jgi:outer membrane protein